MDILRFHCYGTKVRFKVNHLASPGIITYRRISCALALHEARARHISAEPRSREDIALQSSRRMIWDMCTLAIDTIQGHNISHHSFVGMCCVFRAAVIFLNNSPTEDRASDGEKVRAIMPTLRVFSERWPVGGEHIPL